MPPVDANIEGIPTMSIHFTKSYQRVFGTFPLQGEGLRRAVEHAVDAGYRAFDTAQMYRNEADTGKALASSGLRRDEFCLTTKVLIENFDASRFVPSVEESLRKLRVDRVDVLLVHWPPGDGNVRPSLEQLQRSLELGLASNIGISNYNSAMMREARAIVDAPLATNQVEFHPLLNQDKLLATAAETGIPLSAYCSVARGKVFDYPVLAEIGNAYGRTVGQVVLRWIVQKGVVPVTMSTNPVNIRANFDIMDFSLSDDDMSRIDELTKTGYRIVNKSIVPFAPEWD